MVEAVAYLHTAGIIHRDLKCDNILIQNGVLKITDFGTAKNVGTSTHGAQTMIGTPYFMAPETRRQSCAAFFQKVCRCSSTVYFCPGYGLRISCRTQLDFP